MRLFPKDWLVDLKAILRDPDRVLALSQHIYILVYLVFSEVSCSIRACGSKFKGVVFKLNPYAIANRSGCVFHLPLLFLNGSPQLKEEREVAFVSSSNSCNQHLFQPANIEHPVTQHCTLFQASTGKGCESVFPSWNVLERYRLQGKVTLP